MEEGKPTLVHLVSSNRWGGVQRYAFDICRHFSREGWDVVAVTRDAKVVDDHFREIGVRLVHSPLRGFLDPASAILFARLLKKLPRGQVYVHVHRYRDAFTVLLAKRLAGRPDVRVISTRHTVRQGRNTWLFRRIYDKINAHIFVSRTAFERFSSSWPGSLPMDESKVHILHNSVNPGRKDRLPEPDKGPVFAVYTGPVVKGKGLETLIDALAGLKDMRIRLRIVGKGNPDYFDALRRRAMTRGVMDFIDWKSGGDCDYEFIVNSHFAVLPSVEREAFGYANADVMAAGRPQICSPNGAQSEYLTDGETALFVPPADAHALAEAMRKLAEDASLRERMGSAAFDAYQRSLAWDPFITHLRTIYTH